ncbi:MAG: PKD domain-containing protein [Bacteroidia bacterium]
MKKLLSIFSLLISFTFSAQNDYKRPNLVLINPYSEVSLKYEKALTHTDFEEYRLLNERRRIPIAGTDIEVELFSANELNQKYGTPISPLTLKTVEGTKNIRLQLADNNYSMAIMEYHNMKGWLPALSGKSNPVNRGLPSATTGTDCATSDPFCTGTNYQFPASTSTTAQTGPDYGCLLSQPNPAWYYMQVATSGNIIINISGTGGYDVDFICWGPFASPSAACTGISSSGSIIDCSYSTSATETCTINNAVAGQFYMLLITNFSGQAQDINFGSDPSSTGATNCSIVCGLTASSTGPYCVGQTIQLNSSLVAGATYTWTGPGGAVIGNTQNVTIPNATVGMSGTYTVSAQDPNGICTSTVAVTVASGPSVTVTGTPTVCAGTAGTLTASGVSSYTWSTGATTNTMTASPSTTTVYTVSGTTGSCPVTTATGTIVVTPQTTLSVNSPSICNGSSVVLTATGGTTYTWSANAGGATTNTVSVSPSTTTVYTVTADGGGTCAPPVTSTVSVVPSLTVTVNNPPQACAGVPVTLTAGGAASYTWTPSTGLSSANGATVTATPSVTTTYTVTGSSGSCPNSSTVTTVSVTPVLTLSAGSATICPGTTATLTASGGSTYSWSPATGLSTTSGSVTAASPGATTSYTVSGGACDIPATCTVTVIPTCSITVNSATICPNASATLTANGGGSYTWSPATGLSATSGGVVTASPGSTTTYTISSSSGGFTTTTTATVLVLTSPTISVNNATICQGKLTTLTANGASTYTWAPATGLSATTASVVVASPTVTTTYTITGMATNTCTNTTVATIGVNPMPTATIMPTDTAGCQPLCVTFRGWSSTSGVNYSWKFGDGTISSAQNPVNCFKLKGVYNPTLTVTDGNNCSGRATSTVTVHPTPHAAISASPQPVSILEPTIQFADMTTNGPAVMWAWNFGDMQTTLDTSAVKNPKYTYADTGSYVVTLWVSTVFGCIDSTQTTIHIDDDYELFVPTAFSPNGDKLNEVFLPVMRGVLADYYHLYIYDRWGKLVFETHDLYKGWDGTYHGQVVLEDVFVWKILLKTTTGTKKQIAGHVSVVK